MSGASSDTGTGSGEYDEDEGGGGSEGRGSGADDAEGGYEADYLARYDNPWEGFSFSHSDKHLDRFKHERKVPGRQHPSPPPLGSADGEAGGGFPREVKSSPPPPRENIRLEESR